MTTNTIATAAALATARAAAVRATDLAVEAHARSSFAALAAEDALSAAANAADDEDHAAAHAHVAAAWGADADAHREAFHAAMAEASLWNATATAVGDGLLGRVELARALVSLLRRGRVDLDRAVEVIANPAAGVVVGDEVTIEDPDGVGYSLWGNPVYW